MLQRLGRSSLDRSGLKWSSNQFSESSPKECRNGDSGWQIISPLPKPISSGQAAYEPDSKTIYHFGGHAITPSDNSGPPINNVYNDVYSLAYSPGNWKPWKKAGKLKVARNQGKVLLDVRSGYFWLLGGFNEPENQIERWKPNEGGKIIYSDKYYNDRRSFAAFLIENKF